MRQFNIRMDAQIALLAVAETGSFEAAGKHLGIGKSAVHKRVHSLDSELGASVFRQDEKGLVPTEAGSIYLHEVRESVRHARLGVDRVRAFLRVQSQDIRVGYSTYLNTRLLDVIRRLHPRDIENVSRESLLTHQVMSGVLQGSLHIGFGILPVVEPGLSARLLFEEPLMACLPVGHRLSTKSRIQPEELNEEAIIAVSRIGLPGRHQDIVSHFESLGVALRFVADAYSAKEALWLVTQGVGISLLTKFSAAAYRNDIVVRPFDDRLLTLKSGIVTRRDHGHKTIADFVDLAWSETKALRVNSI